MPKLPMKSIDMILCDLPYGITKHSWDKIIPLAPLWKEYERVIKDDGAIVLFANQPFASTLVMSNLKLFRYEWIWEKSSCKSHLNIHRGPMKRHENILVFYKAIPTYHPQKVNGEYPRSILSFGSAPHHSRLHPTEKPVPLLQYLIETYTSPGQIVMDNCCGSGATAEACFNTGRHFIGIDKTQTFVDAAQGRLTAIAAQLPLPTSDEILHVGCPVAFRPPVGIKIRHGVITAVAEQTYTVRGKRDNQGRVEEFTLPHNQVQAETDYQRGVSPILFKIPLRNRFKQHQSAVGGNGALF